MTFFDSIILGIVEGVTEYLPISSTGHLILTEHFLGLGESESAKVFAIAVQLGALLAVVVLYWDYLLKKCRSFINKERSGIHFFTGLFIAFLPSAIIGLAFGSKIKKHLFNPFSVMLALLVGGVLMIVVEYFLKNKKPKYTSYENFPHKESFYIGCCQILSLWPGFSRSMSTILGGRFFGLNPKDASEFSFFLALPTLGAATLYEILKAFKGGLTLDSSWWINLFVGLVVSFIVAMLVIKAFLYFLRKFPLTYFGVYRIILAALVYKFWT